MKLWATYYHMPTVRPSWTSVAAKPLIGKNGKAVSPPALDAGLVRCRDAGLDLGRQRQG